MAQDTCTIEGCDRALHARGWCNTHYQRWRAHGDPLWRRVALIESFWEHVDIRGPDECWPWTGPVLPQGYATLRVGGCKVPVHRVAYGLCIGPIPDAHDIDHTCHNADAGCAGGWTCPHRRCCNPAHLEAVTHAVNVARGLLGAARRAQTHCKHGHPLSGDNLYEHGGKRACRECRHQTKQRHRERQASSAGV